MTAHGTPDWLLATAGPVSDAAPLRSGFTNEAWRVTDAAGRRLVVTRLTDPDAAGRLLDRATAVIDRLADVGIPSPAHIAGRSDRARSVVTSLFVEGVPGMDLIGDDAGAGVVGRIVGAAWLALGAVDVSGLDLDDLWARPADLTAAAASWLEPVRGSLGRRGATRVRDRIAGLPSLLEHRPSGFVHGDLVPANVLIANRTMAALLDLETVRIGDRVLDAAWFRWIVRYHHPTVEPAAWSGFVAGSRLDPEETVGAALIEILPVVRILEILAMSPLRAAARTRWIEQLRACVDRPRG